MRPPWIAMCILLSAFAAFAQDDSGSITGVVTDQDGTVVSGAPIQAKNMKTGTLYKTVSSANGTYTLERLPAGSYELANPVIGLNYRIENVVVQASKTLRLDIRAVDNSLNSLGEDRAFFTGLASHTRRRTVRLLAPRTVDPTFPEFGGNPGL